MTDMPRILCIEDDPEILELLREVLEEADFKVEVAADGISGLARIREQPDLILCDIDMPGLTGFEVLEEIRRASLALRDTPFLFLTAYGARENQIRAYQLRCDGYITKPIDFELLIEIVRSKLQKSGSSSATKAQFRLTEREIEVLTWAARGKSSADIAALAGISERTVNFHIDNVMRKTGVTSRVQAAVLCTTLGVIQP
jgi:DNA-binding NarL/FixJ family response regulator